MAVASERPAPLRTAGGALLTELHVHVVTGDAATRRAALPALVEACIVAAGIACPLGNTELAVRASERPRLRRR
ncbi:MAG: hypothetical protein M3Z25_15440 [Actinomycetota bacterium]|nr:hypothetical protein [Actinomycetota bacterium]